MTSPPPLKIICAAHFGGRRSVSLCKRGSPEGHGGKKTNCFQLNPILSCRNKFLTAGKRSRNLLLFCTNETFSFTSLSIKREGKKSPMLVRSSLIKFIFSQWRKEDSLYLFHSVSSGQLWGDAAMFSRAMTLHSLIHLPCLLPWSTAWICLQCSMLNITNRGLRGCCQGLPVWSLSFSLNCCIGKQTNNQKKNLPSASWQKRPSHTYICRTHIYPYQGFLF